MIKRSITSVVLLTGLLCSAGAFAGTAPTCHADTFNMVIVNKNLVSDDCWDGGVHGTYCLYYPGYAVSPLEQASCKDFRTELLDGESISISEPKTPQSAEIDVQLYNNIDKSTKVLRFNYSSPTAYRDNCSAIFGGGVSCVLSKSKSGNHTTYELTISQTQ